MHSGRASAKAASEPAKVWVFPGQVLARGFEYSL